MCLIIDKTIHVPLAKGKAKVDALIADRDILVWKVIGRDNLSKIRKFKYEPNKEYTAKFGISDLSLSYSATSPAINSGLHSYASRAWARYFYIGNNVKYKIVKFCIPKGAKYYVGIYGDLVSNQIRSGDLKHCR